MLCFICFLLCFSITWADFVVSQDKNGNLTITNQASKSKRKSGGFTYVSSKKSNKASVPQKYRQKIKELSNKYGVKESLIIAVARAESGFNPFAVSKKGAVGIMQLMPKTALEYGVINRYNADQNLEAGVKHLKYLHKVYKGDLPLVLAAYNAGGEAVKKHKGVPPYSETQNYIKRVMKYMGKVYNKYTYKNKLKIYQYQSEDGKIVITDSYPSNAKGPVTVID